MAAGTEPKMQFRILYETGSRDNYITSYTLSAAHSELAVAHTSGHIVIKRPGDPPTVVSFADFCTSLVHSPATGAYVCGTSTGGINLLDTRMRVPALRADTHSAPVTVMATAIESLSYGSCRPRAPHHANGYNASGSTDRVLVTGYRDGVTKVWDFRRLDRPMFVSMNHGAAVTDLVLSSLSTCLLSSSLDGSVNFYDYNRSSFLGSSKGLFSTVPIQGMAALGPDLFSADLAIMRNNILDICAYDIDFRKKSRIVLPYDSCASASLGNVSQEQFLCLTQDTLLVTRKDTTFLVSVDGDSSTAKHIFSLTNSRSCARPLSICGGSILIADGSELKLFAQDSVLST